VATQTSNSTDWLPWSLSVARCRPALIQDATHGSNNCIWNMYL